MNKIVKGGGIGAVVPLLDFECIESASKELKSSAADVEKEACFILGLLAIKNEHQQSIANAGAIAKLVALLSRHSVDLRPGYQNSKTEEAVARRGGGSSQTRGDEPQGGDSFGSSSVARRAADAITNLAHENVAIKAHVRMDGGIPPLVALCEAGSLLP